MVEQALLAYLIQRRLQDALTSSHLSKRDGDGPLAPAITPAPTDPVPTTSMTPEMSSKVSKMASNVSHWFSDHLMANKTVTPPSMSPTTLATTTKPTVSEMSEAYNRIVRNLMEYIDRMDEIKDFFRDEDFEATAAPPLVTLSPALASEISRLPVEAQVAVSSLLKHNSETAFYPSTSDPHPAWTTVTATRATEYDNPDFYPTTSEPNPLWTTVTATFTDPSLNTATSATTYSSSASTFVTVATKAPESDKPAAPHARRGGQESSITEAFWTTIPASAFYTVAETDSYDPAKVARDAAETSPSTTPYAGYIPASAFYTVAATDSYTLAKLARDAAEASPSTTPYAGYIPASAFYTVVESDSYTPARLARDAVDSSPSTTPYASYIPTSAFYTVAGINSHSPAKLARDAEKTPAPTPTKFVTATHNPTFDNPRATWMPAPDRYAPTNVPREALVVSKGDKFSDEYADRYRFEAPHNGEKPVVEELENTGLKELETRGLKDAWKKFNQYVKFFPSPIKVGAAKGKRADEG